MQNDTRPAKSLRSWSLLLKIAAFKNSALQYIFSKQYLYTRKSEKPGASASFTLLKCATSIAVAADKWVVLSLSVSCFTPVNSVEWEAPRGDNSNPWETWISDDRVKGDGEGETEAEGLWNWLPEKAEALPPSVNAPTLWGELSTRREPLTTFSTAIRLRFKGGSPWRQEGDPCKGMYPECPYPFEWGASPAIFTSPTSKTGGSSGGQTETLGFCLHTLAGVRWFLFRDTHRMGRENARRNGYSGVLGESKQTRKSRLSHFEDSCRWDANEMLACNVHPFVVYQLNLPKQ